MQSPATGNDDARRKARLDSFIAPAISRCEGEGDNWQLRATAGATAGSTAAKRDKIAKAEPAAACKRHRHRRDHCKKNADAGAPVSSATHRAGVFPLPHAGEGT